MASPNFRSLFLLFQVFCNKDVGLMTVVLVPVLGRAKVQATRDRAVFIHSSNSIVLNLPASVEAPLRGLSLFIRFNGVHFKFLPILKREKGMRFFF